MRWLVLCLSLSACGDDDGGVGPGEDGAGTGPDGSSPTADAGMPLLVGETTITLSAGGMERQVLVHVPSGWSEGQPAMVALHGNGDTAAGFGQWSGLVSLADAEGFALALPIAIPGHFMGVDWDAYSDASSNLDLPLVHATRDVLLAGGAAPARVYLLGHSQGGFLAYRAAMEGSTTYAAVHVASAGDPFGGGSADGAARKIPVDLLIGVKDGLLSVAQATRDDLERLGFDYRYTEAPGQGHCCPLMGRAPDVWSWLSSRAL